MSEFTFEQIPAFIEAREKQTQGVAPNFVLVHKCPQCGSKYLCPDRYIRSSCAEYEWWKSKGVRTLSECVAHLCSPCAAQCIDEERSKWYQVNGEQNASIVGVA